MTSGIASKQSSSGRSGESIAIMHGTYAWTNATNMPPTLSDINLSVPKGVLCMVVGTVGSGKSSLLAAIMGEMRCISGSVAVDGSLAYTAQVLIL
jgi:ABC-type cobalamin/Fe3+-siderophores transport system ATPase subunit